jgi:transcriptional regulator with XRE-family HTH domain
MKTVRPRKLTLGQLVKKWRKDSNLSQRALARRLRVSSSSISYIERGDRLPSLLLLARIADLIGIEKSSAFILARPDARSILGTGKAKPAANAWLRFAGDRALLARYCVTPSELKVLRQVGKLGRVANPSYFLFVLNSIRQAMDDQ